LSQVNELWSAGSHLFVRVLNTQSGTLPVVSVGPVCGVAWVVGADTAAGWVVGAVGAGSVLAGAGLGSGVGLAGEVVVEAAGAVVSVDGVAAGVVAAGVAAGTVVVVSVGAVSARAAPDRGAVSMTAATTEISSFRRLVSSTMIPLLI
jgi:hypothetical protein